MALETTKGYKNGKALAREMARVLKKSACDLSEPIPLTFYLFLPDRKSANACAKVLRVNGYEVELGKVRKHESWIFTCHKVMKFSEKVIARLGDQLLALAKEYKGDFDGWETYHTAQPLMDLLNLLAVAEAKKS